jgi:hypothetical protein
MSKFTIVDIETGPRPETDLVPPEFEANKNYKDPVKIAADIEAKKKAWLEEAALHADRGMVLTIGLFDHHRKTLILEGSEREILEHFWHHYNQSTGPIVGHCLVTFDIPFLVRRSWINGVFVPGDVLEGKYLNRRFLDTMQKWALGTRDTITLDALAKAFGLPGKTEGFTAKDFAPNYILGGTFREKALAYQKNDLVITHAVAVKMQLVGGEV